MNGCTYVLRNLVTVLLTIFKLVRVLIKAAKLLKRQRQITEPLFLHLTVKIPESYIVRSYIALSRLQLIVLVFESYSFSKIPCHFTET